MQFLNRPAQSVSYFYTTKDQQMAFFLFYFKDSALKQS